MFFSFFHDSARDGSPLYTLICPSRSNASMSICNLHAIPPRFESVGSEPLWILMKRHGHVSKLLNCFHLPLLRQLFRLLQHHIALAIVGNASGTFCSSLSRASSQ